jgi:hypothetical protein
VGRTTALTPAAAGWGAWGSGAKGISGRSICFAFGGEGPLLRLLLLCKCCTLQTAHYNKHNSCVRMTSTVTQSISQQPRPQPCLCAPCLHTPHNCCTQLKPLLGKLVNHY